MDIISIPYSVGGHEPQLGGGSSSWFHQTGRRAEKPVSSFYRLPSLKLTVRPWKWMVGRPSFPFGARPIFRGELLVSGSVVCLFVYLNRFFQVLYTLNILLTQTVYYILLGEMEGDGFGMFWGTSKNHSLIRSAGFLKEDLPSLKLT